MRKWVVALPLIFWLLTFPLIAHPRDIYPARAPGGVTDTAKILSAQDVKYLKALISKAHENGVEINVLTIFPGDLNGIEFYAYSEMLLRKWGMCQPPALGCGLLLYVDRLAGLFHSEGNILSTFEESMINGIIYKNAHDAPRAAVLDGMRLAFKFLRQPYSPVIRWHLQLYAGLPITGSPAFSFLAILLSQSFT